MAKGNRDGVIMSVKGSKLIIEVDISQEAISRAPFSSSGKNKTVATTGGLTDVPGVEGIRVGLNVVVSK